jgi:hypothetical protein
MSGMQADEGDARLLEPVTERTIGWVVGEFTERLLVIVELEAVGPKSKSAGSPPKPDRENHSLHPRLSPSSALIKRSYRRTPALRHRRQLKPRPSIGHGPHGPSFIHGGSVISVETNTNLP